MKSSIVTYPDQQFAIGPGKCLSGREKYEDCAKRLSTVYGCTGDYRLRPVSEGLRVHRGTVLPRFRRLNHFSRGRTITFFLPKWARRPGEFSADQSKETFDAINRYNFGWLGKN